MKLIDNTKQTTDFTKVRAYLDSAGDLVFHPKYGGNKENNCSPWIFLQRGGTVWPALGNVPTYQGLVWAPEDPNNTKLFFVGDRITFEFD